MADRGLGDVVNLDQALLRYMRGYRPSLVGPCFISEEIQIGLPVPEWAWYGWVERLTTQSFAIGASGPEVVYTLPLDERALFLGVMVTRLGGDNGARELDYEMPADYGADDTSTGNRQRLIQLTNTDNHVGWPPGQQAVNEALNLAEPILWEPGTTLLLSPFGDGSATSTYRVSISMKKTKLIRAMVP